MSEAKAQADFAVIRQRVTMEMLFEHYQYHPHTKTASEARGPCPLHPTKSQPGERKGNGRSFAANLVKNIFQCFSCGAKGNVIDFVAKIENCSLREAGLKIWQWFSLDEETSSPTAPTLSEPRGEPQTANDRTTQDLLAEISDKLSTIIELLQPQR
jgi:DNA primase